MNLLRRSSRKYLSRYTVKRCIIFRRKFLDRKPKSKARSLYEMVDIKYSPAPKQKAKRTPPYYKLYLRRRAIKKYLNQKAGPRQINLAYFVHTTNLSRLRFIRKYIPTTKRLLIQSTVCFRRNREHHSVASKRGSQHSSRGSPSSDAGPRSAAGDDSDGPEPPDVNPRAKTPIPPQNAGRIRAAFHTSFVNSYNQKYPRGTP